MQKTINSMTIEGRVYDHKLEVKTVQNKASENFGQSYIGGTLDVAVDEEGLNVVTVHYSFVKPLTKTGKGNSTYTVLKKIIDENPTWIQAGKDSALKVKCTPSIDLNDFYNANGELISAKRNEGGFITIISELNKDEKARSSFVADMVITNLRAVEANPEKNIEEHSEISGVIFKFNGAILPVSFSVYDKQGIQYFENLDISGSKPVFIKIFGALVCKTIVVSKTQDTVFGQAVVTNYENKSKEYIAISAATPYEFDTPETITADELRTAIQNREVYLASVKKQAEEYRAQQAAVTAPTNMPNTFVPPQGDFTF